VTTSKYFIHSGRGIHKEVTDRRLRGEQISESEERELEEESKKEVFYTDMGRVVYGGGGITPDIEIDQSTLTPFQIEFRRHNLFFPFSIDYLLHNESEVSEDFTVSEELLAEFLDYAREKEVEFSKEDIDNSKNWLKNSLRSNIISRKFGDKAGYMVSLELDTQLQKTLNILDQFDTLQQMFAYAEDLREEKTVTGQN